jgi:multiple sugar transport system substrate-binding protein
VTRLAPALLLVAAIALPGCGGSKDASPRPKAAALTLWIEENQPERVKATRENVDEFTRRTGVPVELVPLGDDELPTRIAAAARANKLPDVLQVSMAEAHQLAAKGILDPGAAQQVVDQLGEETFSARALGLLTSGGSVTAVPSDGWGQLLIYRKDLFDRAGLAAPASVEDVVHAARVLDRGQMAGIALPTGGAEGFTAETFEHIALAEGCRLVDEGGKVSLDSDPCRRTFALYRDLVRDHGPAGPQDVDTTRDAYFAGRAAMIFWSPFLLDAMAGLRDEAKPTCPECRDDPAYLATHSGLVGPLAGAGSPPAQYGSISTWGLARSADPNGRRLVTYLVTDGYLRWLALSPQGKYPVRAGDGGDVDRYVRGWSKLESGVDRHAPLSSFYSPASIASLGEGVASFRRWGFESDQAPLAGAIGETYPVTRALAAAIAGDVSPDEAARRAQLAVERIQASLR